MVFNLHHRAIWVAIAFVLLPAGGLIAYYARPVNDQAAEPEITLPAESPEATSEQVHEMCGACHAYPPPDSVPRSRWRKEIAQGFTFFQDSALTMDFPSLESVVVYYEHRAPEDLPSLPHDRSPNPAPIKFESASSYYPPQWPLPAVSNVSLVHLSDKRKPDALVCDMHYDRVFQFKPYAPTASWKELGPAPAPAHAEVVDLDGDGIPDIVVACLGAFYPTNGLTGSVVWLRGKPDGTFTPITLLENVGRVADVQVADFNGDGKLDLIVAVFGWRTTGSILYLENQTIDWSHPHFVPHVVDDRHGTINVPVCDLNHDGRPDFVALISQEHETIVAFLNEGGGKFRKETIYSAPHPSFGSSGIQLVDLDGDGDLDVLYTNGDSLDSSMLRPEHGIQWLENEGGFPFKPHHLAYLYGAMRAVAADFQGNGRKDIVAVSYQPPAIIINYPEARLDSILYLEQTVRGAFTVHSLEQGHCNHLTCCAGDLDGKGRTDFVIGNHYFRQTNAHSPAIEIWRRADGSKSGQKPGAMGIARSFDEKSQ
jgi:FG-GAP-like repeat